MPRSGLNSNMQLNMGLGKSSVIVPIVAATLAGTTKHAKVVVLKELSEQMLQVLVSKLGGLLGRHIYRLPISRSLSPTLESATLIQTIYTEAMASGGIFLVQVSLFFLLFRASAQRRGAETWSRVLVSLLRQMLNSSAV
jgi:hypothetical protein